MAVVDKSITQKKDESHIQSIVKSACEEAIDFIESEISEVRNKSQRYYEGEVDIGYEAGTSKVVATKVRDTIRVIMPNLMRVFLAATKPVEFVPKRPDQAQQSDQVTEYVNREFERLNGYGILYQAMHDAVTKKAGFVKAYWDNYTESEYQELSNITDEELAMIEQDPNVEIEELESVTDESGMSYNTVKLRVDKKLGEICMEVIPPEDFFIDDGATCFDDALVYGHQTEMRVTDLVEMGFDFEEVYGLGLVSEDDTTEKYERADYTDDDSAEFNKDPALKRVTVTEAYMKVDVDGDGEAVMHRFFLGGSEYKILEMEKWTGHCIHKFECDPIPHLFFGNSYPELLFNDQDAATSMLRGMLNNIAQTNIPRTEVNDEQVNMDDMLNNEIGGVVRVKQMGNINPLLVPFIAGEVLPAMQYYDMAIEAKAGVNNLSAGLNPDMLQNQTATAVNAVTQAGANQLESIARHIADGGMCSLFQNLLELTVENVSDVVFMRQEGNEFQPVSPASWQTDFDMTVNVGLGTGQEDQKAMALMQLIPLQKEALMTGSTNLTGDNIRNSVADILSFAGLYNVDRYWPAGQPPPQPPQPQPDPAQALVAVEQVKGQNQLQVEQMKQQGAAADRMADLQMQMIEMAGKDDLARDQMAQDLMVQYAQILGEYGIKVDVAQIQAAQNMLRPPPGHTGHAG
jgi:hypothetical protein